MASLSRKNYVAVAAVIDRIAATPQMDQYTVHVVAGALADYFEDDNPDVRDTTGRLTHKGFDRDRFIHACYAHKERTMPEPSKNVYDYLPEEGEITEQDLWDAIAQANGIDHDISDGDLCEWL